MVLNILGHNFSLVGRNGMDGKQRNFPERSRLIMHGSGRRARAIVARAEGEESESARARKLLEAASEE